MAVYSGGTLWIDLSSPSTCKGSLHMETRDCTVDFLVRIRDGETQRDCKLTVSGLRG
jgi:hypothetical protein